MSSSSKQPETSSPSVPYRQIRAEFDADTITVYQAYNEAIGTAAVAEQKLDASPLFKPTRMTWVKPSWGWMLYRSGYSYKDAGQARILAIKMRHEHFVTLLELGVLSVAHDKDPPSASSSSNKPSGSSTSAGPSIPTGPSSKTKSPGKDKSKDKDKSDSSRGRSSSKQPSGASSSAAGKKKRSQAERSPTTEVRIQWDPERDVRLRRLKHRSIQIGIPASLSPTWTTKWIHSIEDVTDRARELKRVLQAPGGADLSEDQLIEMGLVPVEREYIVPWEVRTKLKMGDTTKEAVLEEGAWGEPETGEWPQGEWTGEGEGAWTY